MTTAPGVWIDSETYAFNPDEGAIDRDRFFVTHKQQVVGDNTDLIWNSSFFGVENRFAAQLSVSRNEIQFAQEQNPDDYPFVPFGSVTVVNPIPGLYTLTPEPGFLNSRLDDAAITIEDQLKITPMLALIGGTAALHRAIHGRVGIWPIWSVLFVYNAELFWGFPTLFASGIYLFAFAGWIATGHWRVGPRIAAFAAVATVLCLLHLFAFGLYAL